MIFYQKLYAGHTYYLNMETYRSGHNEPHSKCALALAVFSAENP